MIYDGDGNGDKRDTFDDLERIVRRTTKALRPHLDRFDAIAVTGMSGASVGFPVALRLGVPIVAVRKGEMHHQWSGNGVVGYLGLPRNARILFLDDFVTSGATRERVSKSIARLGKGHKIVGQYLYSATKDWTTSRTTGELYWTTKANDWAGSAVR